MEANSSAALERKVAGEHRTKEGREERRGDQAKGRIDQAKMHGARNGKLIELPVIELFSGELVKPLYLT